MKCSACGCEWMVPAGMEAKVRMCPYCGTAFVIERRKPNSLEEAVCQIRQEVGLNSMIKQNMLMGCFLDLAPEMKREQQKLRRLIEVNGHTTLIQALSLSQGEQMREIEKLILQMREQLFVEETIARSICVDFFRGIGGTIPMKREITVDSGAAQIAASAERCDESPIRETRIQERKTQQLTYKERLESVRKKSELIERHILIHIECTILTDLSGRVSYAGVRDKFGEGISRCSCWNDIRRIFVVMPPPFVGGAFAIGVTAGGKIVHTSKALRDPILNKMTKWSNIQDLSLEEYWNGRTAYGIKRDGTVVAAISNAALDSAAALRMENLQQAKLERLKEVRKIICKNFCGEVVCLTRNGTLISTGDGKSMIFRQIESWRNLREVYYFPVSYSEECSEKTGRIVGLKQDGTLVATVYMGSDSDGTDWSEAARWTDIVQILTLPDGRIVGLGANGLPRITNRGKAGGEEEWVYAFLGWTGIAKLYYHCGYLVGLQEDGHVVTIRCTTLGQSEYPGQMDINSWDNLAGIKFGFRYTIGVKRDGSYVTTKLHPNDDKGQTNTSVLRRLFSDYNNLFSEFHE